MQLTSTMKQAIEYAQHYDNVLHRHPGGFWAKDRWSRSSGHFGTPTVEALVTRGVMQYTDWKEGRNGKFPIKAELTEKWKKA